VSKEGQLNLTQNNRRTFPGEIFCAVILVTAVRLGHWGWPPADAIRRKSNLAARQRSNPM